MNAYRNMALIVPAFVAGFAFCYALHLRWESRQARRSAK